MGIVVFQQLVELPSILWAFGLAPLLPVILIQTHKIPVYVRIAGVLIVGFLWVLLLANIRMAKTMPPTLEGIDITVSGFITSLPRKQGLLTQFEFDIVDSDSPDVTMKGLSLPARVRLNWYGQRSILNVGDKWTLRVRLKAPHGFMNPGGFDYEGWLFANTIMATGYVRSSAQNKRLDTGINRYWFNRLRASMITALSRALRDVDNKGTILALVMGDRQQIDAVQWALFRQTGTSHLIAISGLHIGLIASFMFFLAAYIWRGVIRVCPSLGLRLPRKSFQAVMALLAASLYAALAGFSLPTVRALIMLLVVLLTTLLRRPFSAGASLGLALIAVLLWDPFAVSSAGFWLSFSAVAVLLYGLHCGRQQDSRLWRAFNIQFVLIVALLPLGLFWFQYAALSSSLANLVAIPYVSFLVVPLSLLGALLLPMAEPFAILLLRLSGLLLTKLNELLQLLSGLPMGHWEQHQPSWLSLIVAGIGILIIISPRGLPARWVGAILMLPMFFVLPLKPKPGEAWFTLLDVGQGLSAVIQTSEHALVFDTGAKFSEHFDTGSSVVIPFLRNRGIKQLDTLIISHSDNDHIGGAASLLQVFMPDKVYSGEPLPFEGSFQHDYCRQGQEWSWDGVVFKILYPFEAGRLSGNNASCVLAVEAYGQRILIAGDIEKQAEIRLLSSEALAQTDILVAPHHGSRTSSTKAFIVATAPRYVLFAAGYRNRYGFPKQDVVGRYQAQGSKGITSFESGAVTFKLESEGLIGPLRYRVDGRKYWHHRL